MLKPFRVEDWLPKEEANNGLFNVADIEKVTSGIEAAQIDITADYNNWIKIGFAFAHELGEEGRSYFHRVSRYYPRYSIAECDKQYDNCLKTHTIITQINTFFYLAKEAGIEIGRKIATPEDFLLSPEDKPIANEQAIEQRLLFNAPLLPAEVYNNLPGLLSECCELFADGIEKDVFLIASLTVLSGCIPNITGIYFEESYSAHLYSFITAPAGSGKGKMKWARYFGQAIHEHLTEQSKREREVYHHAMQQYENLHKSQKATAEKPEEPPRLMFYIPANSSSSAFIQALKDNHFNGVIFETEADTLSVTFKQDWGNFSDVLRKAYHHEDTSMFRRKDNEHIEIKNPHLAIALSGTPNQVLSMMPNSENGLFSRFMYYAFEDDSEFKNPFSSGGYGDYPQFFNEKAKFVYDLYNRLEQLDQPITFKLTGEQGEKFTDIFRTMLRKNKLLLGRDFNANVKRLGLITFRIAMVLTALRLNEQLTSSHTLSSNPLVCTDQDFEIAISIVTTLEKHSVAVFKNMPNNGLKGKSLEFYDKLPNQFDRQGYLKVAKDLGINVKTAEKYLSTFRPELLTHEPNLYMKVMK